MANHRLEITLSDEVWDRLEGARGFEPRASFVKRALESALEGRTVEGASGDAGPVSSRAPVGKESANLADVGDSKVAKADRGGSPASSRQAFKCPDSKCSFRALSARAVCGKHGRTVVAA